jgi:hypothetical protein
MAEQPTGSLETRAEAGEGEKGQVKLWNDAFSIADKEEEDWRKAAAKVVETYRDESMGKANSKREDRFNILFANVETQLPAIYNSVPSPDVRRRFNDEDPAAKIGAQIVERCLSSSIDQYDFDATMQAAVKDMLLVGRGVSRVRYDPILGEDGKVAYETAACEHVPWQLFRRGPGRRWEDVPYVAFIHYLTREQLVELSPKHGRVVKLDAMVDGAAERFQDVKQPPDLFSRAEVREVWDKDKRQVLFIAPGYSVAPLRVEDDPLGLEGFFPCPRPMYAIETTDTLVPIEEYRLYKDQAKELNVVTRRISAIINVLKWRGIYAGSEDSGGVLTALTNAQDGELVPGQNMMGMVSQGGGIDKAIWMMPIDVAAGVLTALYEQRDQIKQTIFEITGLADIMRGQSDSDETLGAQQIKAQWGSLRVQRRQAEVARYARDLMRKKAEIICTKFSWETLAMMSGIKLPSQQDKQMAQQMLMQMQQQQAAQPQPVAA